MHLVFNIIVQLCLWSAIDRVTSVQSGYTLRLVSGKNNYGYVEMSVNDFFGGAFHPICPGKNQQYADLLGNVICQDLGYLDGESMDMKAKNPSTLFWYNTFDVFTDYRERPLIPSINAYVNRNWTLEQSIGQFSYCTSSAIAVFCYGEVSLYQGTTAVTIDSDLDFGAVVLRSSSVAGQNDDNDLHGNPQYVPYLALDDRGFRVICQELGYEGATPTVYDPTVYQSTDTYELLRGLKQGRKKYKCAGDEHKLSDCPTEEFNDDNPAAIIKCTKAKEKNGTYRITSDNVIEIMRRNTWGLACTNERFTELLCKDMGFNYYRHYNQYPNTVDVLAKKLQMMWIQSSDCPQSIAKLADCRLFDFKDDDEGSCEVAFAKCYNDEPIYDLSEVSAYRELGKHFILRTTGHMNGILITDSDDTAQFICKHLKYTYGKNYPISLPSKRIPQSFETNYWKATYNSQRFLCKDKNQRKHLIDDCYEDDWDLVSDSGKKPLVNYMTVCSNLVYLEGNGYFGLVSYMFNSPKLDVAYITKDSINQPEIDLICNHIGFRNGGKLYNGYVNKPHEFDNYDIVCPDGSQKLEECTFTQNPSVKSPVAIECILDGKQLPKYFLDKDGIVHIDINIPTRVCSNSQWDFNTTQIFCRSHGFQHGSSFSRPQDPWANPVGYESVHCSGTEKDFDKCTRVTITSRSPPCPNVVAVTCYNQDSVIDNIRLVDGGNRFGNVMINKSGSERYYCADTFTKEDASTVCKHLGYTSGINIKMDPISNPVALWWVVTNNRCTDTTNRLEACDGHYSSFDQLRYTQHCRTGTASVYCYSKVKFENGPYLNYGVIQDTYSNQRYSNKTFGDTEANIACRDIGFPLGGRAFPTTDSVYKADGTPILMKCTGDEQSLQDCNTQTSSNVDKRFLAAVVCETGDSLPRDGTVKLDYDSRVLVVKDGIWYVLCTYQWMDDGKTTANTICQQQRGSSSGKPNLKHMSSLFTYATCYTSTYDVGERFWCEKRYLDNDDHKFCKNNAAAFCQEETLQVSALSYPRPVEGKSTRSSATVKRIAAPMVLFTLVVYLMFVN